MTFLSFRKHKSFPSGQFSIEWFSTPFRLDRNHEGGGIREVIPCKEIKNHFLPKYNEGMFIELNLRNKKWILCGEYNPKKERISYFLNHRGQSLDKFTGNYDNLLLIGDFNSGIKEENMRDFCDTYNLQNLIIEATYFKSVENPTTIYLIRTNRYMSSHTSIAIETGISDKMAVTVLKTYFKNIEATTIKYRNEKKFGGVSFKTELTHTLQVNDTENMNYDKFKELFLTVLNKHAPQKEKQIRGNNSPFMNKILSKAFTKRSNIKNKYNKFPTEGNKPLHKKQRNFCANLLRKEKRNYYYNLDSKSGHFSQTNKKNLF